MADVKAQTEQPAASAAGAVSVTIRPFRAEDGERVKAMFVGWVADVAPPERREEWREFAIDMASKGDLADIPQQYVRRPRSMFWVADVNGEAKGMVGIQPCSVGASEYFDQILDTEGKDKAENVAELRRMAVASDVRRLGIATTLMQTLFAFAKENGYTAIHLTTNAQLAAARKLYEKFGFKLLKTHVVPWGIEICDYRVDFPSSAIAKTT